MRKHGTRVVLLGALAMSLSLLVACGGDDSREFLPEGDTGGTDSGGGDAVTDSGGGDSGGGDSGGGDADDTGTPTDSGDSGGDGGVPFTGKGAKKLVSGGTTAESPKYRLITTTGELPGYTRMSSSKYLLKNGVVGIAEP